MTADTLEQRLDELAWLHAELSYHHDQLAAEHIALVKQIQAMIQQLVGPAAAANPAHAQAIRARAARIAALRAGPAGSL